MVAPNLMLAQAQVVGPYSLDLLDLSWDLDLSLTITTLLDFFVSLIRFVVKLCTYISQIYGVTSIVSGMSAIWSLSALTLERALVISRLGYRGARKQTMR